MASLKKDGSVWRVQIFIKGVRESAPLGPASMPYTNAVLLNLCGNDHGRALEVMRRLASPLRTPGEKLPQALWVRSDQGTDKSLFFNDLIAPMYGAAAAILPSPESHSPPPCGLIHSIGFPRYTPHQSNIGVVSETVR